MDRFAFVVGAALSFAGALKQAEAGQDLQAAALFVVCFICISTITIITAVRK